MKIQRLFLVLVLVVSFFNLKGQFNPNSLSSLQLWLSSDSSNSETSSAGKIILWKDLSNEHNDASQIDTSISPEQTSNEFLKFGKNGKSRTILNLLNNISLTGSNFSIFMVYKTYGPTTVLDYILSGGNSSTFYGGVFTSGTYYSGIGFGLANQNNFLSSINNASLFGVYSFTSNKLFFNGIEQMYFKKDIVDNLIINAIGSRTDVTSLYFNGELAEVLVFQDSLGINLRQDVEGYLTNKYAPPINLGKDTLISNGICFLTLGNNNSKYNTKYNWSTGDTTSTIKVNKPGTYWVQVKNLFGIVSEDSINITYQEYPILPSDTVICQGSSGIVLNLGIPTNTFTCQWSMFNDSAWNITSTSVSNLISQVGKYSVFIEDINGCSIKDTFNILNDIFASLSIVSDTSICYGNNIKVKKSGNSIKSYLWNNIATTSSFSPPSSGQYSLQTVNQNNCTNNTLFNVTVTGIAPSVNFTSSLPLDTGCLGTSVTFNNSSIFPSGVQINKFNWDYGNGLTNPNVWNPTSSVYSIPGQYFVTLSVSGNNGCSNFQTQKITILNNPSANFSITTAAPYCQNTPINFSNNSQTNGVPITNYAWDFGNAAAGSINNSTSPNGAFSYSIAAPYTVYLTVSNKYGCSNSFPQTLTIAGSPTANFTFNKGCLGTPITFSDSTIQAPGTVVTSSGYNWTFGNGSTATTPTNTITYTAAGNYPVSLKVTNNLGCSNTAYKTVTIKNAPKPGFYTGPACYQRLVQFYDTSKVIGDTITSWQWQFSSSLTSRSQNPQVVLGDSGYYAVNLTVATKSCSVQTSRPINLKVYSLPPVSFSANPAFGLPPLTVTLTSSLTGISKWKWGLGNGTLTSVAVPPLSVVYSDSGTFKVQLTATNSYGCTDSISKSIIVSKPKIDLEVNSVGIVTNNGIQTFSVALYNRGNIPIPGITLYLESANGFELVEYTSITLSVGGHSIYTFASLIPANTTRYPYFCVEAYPTNLTEGNPSNNISCKLLSGSFYVGLPYPNPSDTYIEVPITVSQSGTVTIILTDVAGKQFEPIVSTLATNGYSAIQIQTSSLAAGVYLLYITYQDQIVVQKFVKN